MVKPGIPRVTIIAAIVADDGFLFRSSRTMRVFWIAILTKILISLRSMEPPSCSLHKTYPRRWLPLSISSKTINIETCATKYQLFYPCEFFCSHFQCRIHAIESPLCCTSNKKKQEPCEYPAKIFKLNEFAPNRLSILANVSKRLEPEEMMTFEKPFAN